MMLKRKKMMELRKIMMLGLKKMMLEQFSHFIGAINLGYKVIYLGVPKKPILKYTM